MAAVTALGELGLPEQLVRSCREILIEQASSLKAGEPAEPGAGVFGASDPGIDLERHTHLAHRLVAEALTQMAAGLSGYAASLDGYAKDLIERDLQAAADLTPTRKRELADAADCLDAPDLQANPACTVPGSEG